MMRPNGRIPMLCSVVAQYQALGQAHIGMCLFFYPRILGPNEMETRTPYGTRYFEDTLTAVYSLLCAMGRFYITDRHLLTEGEVPRLLLLNRIASGVEVELASRGMRETYAADLILVDEVLNIGIRSRIPGKNLVMVNLTSRHPSVEPLEKICEAEGAHYLVGIGIKLNRKSYCAVWYASEEQFRITMEEKFSVWTAIESFHCRHPQS